MCILNKQSDLLEFVFDSVYIDLQYDEIFSLLLLGLCGVCGHLSVFGMSVRLAWYPIWMRWLL